MPDNIQQIKNRFQELASRSIERGCYSYSEFLTLAEQSTLTAMRLPEPYELKGGYQNAERKLACFGSLDICGYDEIAPICCMCIVPANPKFADSLTHRDFLGALIGLGIRREVLGDIVVEENKGYLFCLESMADFISSQLTQVKHTSVKTGVSDSIPAGAVHVPEKSSIVVASERLDAVIAAVYKLSRSKSQKFLSQEKVFVNSRMTDAPAYALSSGDTVSVRGFGRFIYEGIEKETHKGRLRAEVRIFS